MVIKVTLVTEEPRVIMGSWDSKERKAHAAQKDHEVFKATLESRGT